MVKRYLTQNPCYKAGRNIAVKGLMLHSVGVAQPDPMVFIRQFDNPGYDRACVHGFIGADETYITLPILETPGQAMRGWHGGKQASNNAYIGVEMTEPRDIKYIGGASFQVLNRTKAVAHVEAATRRAVELFAKLCTFHGLNPLMDIVSHAEGYKLDIASNHGDPDHLWRGLNMNYNMDKFRRDVAAAMKGEDDMTKEEVKAIVREVLQEQQELVYDTVAAVPTWAQPTVRKLVTKGLLNGTGSRLSLNYDTLRVLVINDRAGLYD